MWIHINKKRILLDRKREKWIEKMKILIMIIKLKILIKLIKYLILLIKRINKNNNREED